MSARMLLVTTLGATSALIGCVAPTTYGLKTDGRTPDPGEVEFTAGAAGASSGLTNLSDESLSYWGAGGGVTYGLTEDVAISGAGALGTSRAVVEGESPNFTSFRMAEAEFRWRLVSEDPGNFNLTALIGAGSSIDEPREYNRNWGAHAGLVASHRLGDTARVYYGGKLNPAIDAFYMMGSLGLTADTITEGPVRATFGFETFIAHASLWDDGLEGGEEVTFDPALGVGMYLNFKRDR